MFVSGYDFNISSFFVFIIFLDVNQRVASQLEVVPVLLQLLNNELLDASQKLCIVMCLAVLSDGNSGHLLYTVNSNLSVNHIDNRNFRFSAL